MALLVRISGSRHTGLAALPHRNNQEAVKQAINSPLLDTSIEGASNILINTCGKINLVDLNEAISHVRELAGNHVNIIWGTVSSADFDEDKIVVTLIATGMNEIPGIPVLPPDSPNLEPIEWKSKYGKSKVSQPKTGIVIPSFLLEAQRKH